MTAMNKWIYKITRYASMALMTMFIVTSLSCEREVFWTGGGGTPYNPRRVSITLGYELPEHEELAITRSISSNDEHKVSNFYLLIFQNTSENDATADPVCVYGQYFDVGNGEVLDSENYDASAGNWVSIESNYNNSYGYADDANVNSTHGQVTVEPELDPEKDCYIFGFANVKTISTSEVEALIINGNATSEPYDVLEGFKNSIGGENPKTLSELKNLKIQINNLSTLEPSGQTGETLVNSDVVNRVEPYLLYSGQWSPWTTKRTGEDGKKHNVFDAAALSGRVDLSNTGTGNNYDLRSRGMIYLRCMISHVRFNITVNNAIFDRFVPESWQVVHVPYQTYFIDEISTSDGRLGRKIGNVDAAYGKSKPVTKMVHDEDVYLFDFYMLENLKDATSATNIDYSGDDKSDISNYYKNYFGEYISDTPLDKTDEGSGVMLPSKLALVYGYDTSKAADHPDNVAAVTKFKYAKRELELKTLGGTVLKNDDDKYESKKFVYSEPRSTYVVIKGRLLINSAVNLLNLAGEGVYDENNVLTGVNSASIGTIKNGYADVTYTIHLGYAKNNPTDTNYDETDFSILRNVEYTYNMHIAGINSIITNVKANLEKVKDQPDKGIYRVKAQPGADGIVNLAMENIYNTDAHFNQFNFMLEKSALSDFSFEINTPWNTISSDEVKADIDRVKVEMGLGTIVNGVFVPGDGYATGYGAFAGGGYKDQNSYPTAYAIYQKYITNPDFTWFKFTPAIDQRGMFDAVLSQDDNNNKYRKYRKTVTYDRNSPTLWNLFDFMVSMDGLTASDNQQPLYNEGINQGTDTVDEYRRKIGTAIKTRINNVLYGNDAGTTEGSVTLFECEVNDDNGNNEYTGASALPFLLDKFKYEVTQQDYNFIKTIYDAVTADNSITINDDIYFNKFKRPYIADGRYWVEEDYVQYLKEHDPAHFGNNNQIAPIRRMFYTAYLDEYFYSTPPLVNGSALSWSTPYWKEFVNKPSRYITFGYRGDSAIASLSGTDTSKDGESSIVYSSITILQPSIQTFYNAEQGSAATYALGVEHYNETYDPRWKGADNITFNNVSWSRSNGWTNTKVAMVDNGKTIAQDGVGDWARYVSETVYEASNDFNGIRANVTMKSSGYVMTVDDRMGKNGQDNKAAYLAGALRMCMSRNRDENGNGKIDEEELKWYLPSSNQMDMISLCHYSLTDPLFDFNKFFADAPDADHQRLLPFEDYPYLRGQYLYKHHFATSDHSIFMSEEFVNSTPYSNAIETYGSHPYEMRCVRNLNSNPSVNSTPDDAIVKPFTYENHIFTLNKLDSRSIRNIIYHRNELPSPHYYFSRDNLPYYKFKVASNNTRLKEIVDALSNKKILKNIVELSPCSNYYEETDGTDKGTWRAPNAAEMGLMLMQLRRSGAAQTNDGYYEDANNEFFWNSTSYYPYSSTSWNYTGPWGRVLGAKAITKDNKIYWKFYTSDINSCSEPWLNQSAAYSDGTQSAATNFIVRCVKDLAE